MVNRSVRGGNAGPALTSGDCVELFRHSAGSQFSVGKGGRQFTRVRSQGVVSAVEVGLPATAYHRETFHQFPVVCIEIQRVGVLFILLHFCGIEIGRSVLFR